LNARRIPRINRHPVESDEDSAHESILETEDWLNWNADLDNPNDSDDDCGTDDEFDKEQDNNIEDPESPEQQNVCAATSVPGLIAPRRMSKRHTEKVIVTVNTIETRRNKGVKKSWTEFITVSPASLYIMLECFS
jgi:hypothetical protein